MKYNNIILLSALFTTNLFAAGVPVPYVFTAGDTIRASDINANFQELANRIATQQTSSDKLYVFSTPASYDSGSGRAAFNGHCENIDPIASMCTIERIKYSQNSLGITFDSQFQGGWIDDGLMLQSNNSCMGWLNTNPNISGYILTSGGSQSARACAGIPTPIVCCK